MSNFYSNNRYSNSSSNHNYRRSYKPYHQNTEWNQNSVSPQCQGYSNSHEWFQENWQRIQYESRRSNHNYNSFNNRNAKRKWAPEKKFIENKPIIKFNELSNDVKMTHIEKMKQYLEDDEMIYLDFIGLSLNESSFVNDLNNLCPENIEDYGCRMKEVVLSLCDILTKVKSKLDLEVICEENIDRNLRNITYMKLFKDSNQSKNDSNLEDSISDEEIVDSTKDIQSTEAVTQTVPIIRLEDLYGIVECDLDGEKSATENVEDNDWTAGIWKKSNETSEDIYENVSVPTTKHNKRMKEILKTYSTPVESSIAQRMMEKMGWTGGALGATGEGITDPIVPSVTFKQGAGLGHTKKPQQNRRIKGKQRTQPKKYANINNDTSKSTFKTNVLREILSFLKNDNLLEIAFDPQLSGIDRKTIHVTVECLQCDYENMDFDSMEQIELATEIQDNMNFILSTESQGKKTKRKTSLGKPRQLHLYKTAPEDVYLITSDDLNEEIEEDEDNCEAIDKSKSLQIGESSASSNQKVTESCIDLTDDTNIASKNENCETKDKVSRTDFLKKLLMSYVKEFCEDENRFELKFLGEFSETDAEVINSFMQDLLDNFCSNNESKEEPEALRALYQNDEYDFDMYLKDREGSIAYVIRKTKKNDAKDTQDDICE